MSIKLPACVIVANRTFRVVAMTADERDNIGDGVCNWSVDEIKINTDQSDINVLETLLHEVGHAVNASANITDASTEEDGVTRTTPIWMSVWRDNPDLLELLTWYTFDQRKLFVAPP